MNLLFITVFFIGRKFKTFSKTIQTFFFNNPLVNIVLTKINHVILQLPSGKRFLRCR